MNEIVDPMHLTELGKKMLEKGAAEWKAFDMGYKDGYAAGKQHGQNAAANNRAERRKVCITSKK